MLKPFFDWPKFCFDMINDKNPSIKNSVIAGDGAKVIEAIFQWGFAHVIHITRLMKFFLPILHFSSYFFNSIFVFYLSFCLFWFDFLFLAYFVGSLLHATLRIKFEGLQRIIIDPLFCHLGTFHPRLLSYILCCPIVHLWSFSKLFLSSYWWYIVTLSVIIFGLWF